MIDRLPPQSIEAEQSVLGSILIDRDAVIEVAEFLKARGLLPAGARRRSTRRSLDLFERREPIDIVTVAEALERTDDLEAVGGRAYLGHAVERRRRPRSTRRSTPGSSSARRCSGT